MKKVKQTWQKALCIILTMTACFCRKPGVAFAAKSASKILKPLTNLETLVLAIIGAIGVIIFAKNVMEFAQAYQQNDTSSMNSGLKGIAAGILMASISTVIAFLGL